MATDKLELTSVPVRSEKRERADAAANRVLVLETAARLFEEHGVANVTMADIASAAGIGKGTLYRRFENKAELALALMDRQMTDFQNDVLARLRESTTLGRPFLAQLDDFLDALVYFTDSHLPLLYVVQSTGMVALEEEHSRPYHWQHRTISGLLLRAAQANEIPQGNDADYTADALLAPLRADLFRFQREQRGYSLQRISRGLRSIAASIA